MRKNITFIVGLIVSFGAIYLLIRGDLEVLQDEIAQGRYGFILPGLVLMVLALVARGYRWQRLVAGRTTVWHSFHIMNIGYMLNNLPLRVGELARAYLSTRLNPPIKFFTALSSIAVERILDLIMVVILLAIALLTLDVPATWSRIGLLVGMITIVATGVLFYFATHHAAAHRFLALALRLLPPLRRLDLETWLDHFLEGLQPITSLQAFISGLLWTALGWALSIISTYFLMLVFFDEGSIAASMLAVVMISLAVAIPAMPGNLGTFEAACVAAMWLADKVPSVEAPGNAPALAFAVLLHAAGVVHYVVLGMWGLYVEQTSLGQVRAGVGQLSQETLVSEG